MNSFRDKTVIITGGASGIGRAVGEEMARRGAIVTLADINAPQAEMTAAGIRAGGGRASSVGLDVSDQAAVEKLINDTAQEYGRLDYIFNNAGIGIMGEARDLSIEHYRRTMDVNLWGVIYGTLASYCLMCRQGFGHIINTASLAGLVPSGIATPYATAKHAVVGLSTSLRVEGVGLGVKVSVVCPGVINTPIFNTGTLINADKDTLLSQMPKFMMSDVNKTAMTILKGVSRNQAIIIAPSHTRLGWLLYRLLPSSYSVLGKMMMSNYRRHRREG